VATFLLAHGAWSAAWAWKKMRPLMDASGHTFVAPTYTGLGERAHLATPSVDLETHIFVVSVVKLHGAACPERCPVLSWAPTAPAGG